jgi:hypothetical protein
MSGTEKPQWMRHSKLLKRILTSPTSPGKAISISQLGSGNTMTKNTTKNRINKILASSPGIYSDQYWKAINHIFEALAGNGYNYQIESSQYHHNDQGLPIAKEWRLSITTDNYSFSAIITAHGAGSVTDPLDRYDISAYITR